PLSIVALGSGGLYTPAHAQGDRVRFRWRAGGLRAAALPGLPGGGPGGAGLVVRLRGVSGPPGGLRRSRRVPSAADPGRPATRAGGAGGARRPALPAEAAGV